MEPFIVSARKYRPETFEDVVGQQSITRTLENAIANNHLAQALLFTGPRGVGKTTCARILAKKINQQETENEEQDFAFNIFELDAASNNSVDDIRNLTDQVRIPPQVGKYKVYIIDEVHMLSTAAFNAFLKTLEEPPSHAIFILATTEKHKIIPTILSRCQIFDFRRISIPAMRDHLKRIAEKEGIQADEEALQIIAQKADGALRDSLSIFDRVVSFCGSKLTVEAVTENLNVLDRDTYFRFTDLILENQIPQLLLELDGVLSRGFDGHHFVSGLATHFRDLLMCLNAETISILEVGEKSQQKYREQSQKVDVQFLAKAIQLATDCDINYKNSRNPRLLTELMLMKLASINFPDEKKNDQNYIIPAAKFKDHQPEVADKPVRQTDVEKPKKEEKAPPRPENVAPETPATYAQNTETSLEEPEKEKPKNYQVGEREKPLVTENEHPTPQPNGAAKRVSNLSLGGLRQKRLAQAEQKKREQKERERELPTEPFTQEQLQSKWDEFVAQLERDGSMVLSSTLRIDTPQVDGETIHLTFPNSSLKKQLENEKGPLLQYLRTQLNNHNIDIEIQVNEEKRKKYVYTDKEKYERLVAKNPSLEKLRESFDLDFS